MKLCLFSGTFNPIHNAHLRMADFVLKDFGFDKILFIPAFVPPHKSVGNVASCNRLEMVKLAVKPYEYFQVSDVEFRLNGVSYTYLTILELQKELGTNENFSLIIGTDAFEKIETWYEIDKLKKMVRFIVSKRHDDVDLTRFDHLRDKGFDFVFTSLDFCDISSTEIRENVAEGKPISDLVPREVEDYIYDNGLYRKD